MESSSQLKLSKAGKKAEATDYKSQGQAGYNKTG